MKPFSTYILSDLINQNNSKISEYILSLSDDDILSGQDEKICRNMSAKYGIERIDFGEEIIGNRELKPTKIKHYNQFYHQSPSFMNESEFYYTDGFELKLSFSFSGDSLLFQCRSDHFGISGYPDISIFKGYFVLSTSKTLDEMSTLEKKDTVINEIYKDWEIIKRFMGYVNSIADKFNQSIPSFTQELIEQRKAKISKIQTISQMFDIPITPTNPRVISEIKIERKIEPLIKRKKNNNPEYSIRDDIYIDILDMIKHQCSSFERTPNALDTLGEEQLRDLILGHLNGLFKGSANGECFRKTGKTDISIEYEDRAAFVAECKFWKGKKSLTDALKQLLSYLTWRDNKLSLIMFSRNKDFFKILKEIKETLPLVENYVALNEINKNEFDLKIKSTYSDSHILTVRVFAFDFSSKNS